MQTSLSAEIKTHPSQEAYLFHPPAARAREHHCVSTVVVSRHGGHAIILVHVQWDALDGSGAPQRLIEVLAAEIVVDLQWLGSGGQKKEIIHK